MITVNVDAMGKEALRAACKAQGIKGYGAMINSQMKDALKAHLAKSEAVLTKEFDGGATHTAMSQDGDVVKTTAGPVGVKVASKSKATVQKNRPEQNGVTRPSEGTICADIWNTLDTLRASTGAVPTSKQLIELRDKNGWQKHTASTQFQRWRQFNAVMPRSDAGKDE